VFFLVFVGVCNYIMNRYKRLHYKILILLF